MAWDADHLDKIRDLLQLMAVLAELGDEVRLPMAGDAVIEQVISLRDTAFRAGETYGRGIAANDRRGN